MLTEIAAVRNRYERVVSPVGDERRDANRRQVAAHVGERVGADQLLRGPRARAAARRSPPELAEGRVVLAARGEPREVVAAAPLDVGIRVLGDERLDELRSDADRVVVGTDESRVAVGQHQALRPITGEQREMDAGRTGTRARPDPEPIRAGRIRHGERIHRDRLRRQRAVGVDRVGEADPAAVESNQPAERRQPAGEPRGVRLVVE